MAETYTAHHHKDKAATLHVVPEYEDTDDVPTPGSGNDSNSTLPISACTAGLHSAGVLRRRPAHVCGRPAHTPAAALTHSFLAAALRQPVEVGRCTPSDPDLVVLVVILHAHVELQKLAPSSMHAVCPSELLSRPDSDVPSDGSASDDGRG